MPKTIRGHTDWVNGVVHLPGGRNFVTCSWDGSLRLWDLESGTQIGEDWWDDNNAVRSMALSPNGKTIASGSGGGDYNVRLWDVKTKKVIAKWTGHTYVVCALCWSADGERVVSGSWDGTARIWNVKSGQTVLMIETGHNWAETEENAVKIWHTKTGELLKTLKHDGMVYSLAWTSDRKKLIAGSYGLIRIFNTATWNQIAILEGYTNWVTNISLSPNNRLLASASLDSTARLWNLKTNLQIGLALQHEEVLWSATLSPDGQVLATACGNKNVYTRDVHTILKDAGLQKLLPKVTNIAPKDRLEQKASKDRPEQKAPKERLERKSSQDDSGSRHTPRSSLDDKSFLEADATRYPGQFGNVDELPSTFFDDMETNDDSSPMGGVHPHSSVNALLTCLSSLLRRFRPDCGEMTKIPQHSRPSAFHLHALLARLSSLIHHSRPGSDELQQPSTPLRLNPDVLLAQLSSFFSRSRLGTDEEAEPHPAVPSSSRPGALTSQLSSLFCSQPHTNEKIELLERPSYPRVVEVAAVRDRQTLVVARGPKFKKAKRAYEQQTQSHGQVQASSSHTQPVSTSATPPAPGTTTAGAAAAQSPPIPWRAQIVLFLCCASPPLVDAH
ncbi:WD40-repeat-containing domain protein [Suillus subaureus]|uniref:WD40-repeat-containing domain protein n=1 Tax=Suillus subaureus TaxID=48587 RepID=A0A9P7DTE3_9AGAM|nr:WD40-repeat-containing domain protein [Suillus subaureus]KAG1802549.1 WD40-repeat-containing domain protein [Suillus subaureus]